MQFSIDEQRIRDLRRELQSSLDRLAGMQDTLAASVDAALVVAWQAAEEADRCRRIRRTLIEAN